MVRMLGTNRVVGGVFRPHTSVLHEENREPELHKPIAFNPFKAHLEKRVFVLQKEYHSPRLSLRQDPDCSNIGDRRIDGSQQSEGGHLERSELTLPVSPAPPPDFSKPAE